MIHAAYYNEFNPEAAAMLRQLIKDGHIAPGDVDERSITEVSPDDLKSYTQCHFFAGIGGWSMALRLAGVPDSRPVWTGSCPCQPLSSAGRQLGAADARHLWPEFYRLIKECDPAEILGEQVDKKLGRAWLAAVRADLETLGYAVGAVDTCSAGVGSPHIRQRHYWVAHSKSRSSGSGLCDREQGRQRGNQLANCRSIVGMADSNLHRQRIGGGTGCESQAGYESRSEPRGCGETCGLANGICTGLEGYSRDVDDWDQPGWERKKPIRPTPEGSTTSGYTNPQTLHNPWRDVDWLFCRDGKWRPVEPGTFPLAHGVPFRRALLHGSGNAINIHQAATFIQAAI
jgi:DNA (cytosine-5)-methyltransferase 1